MKRIRSITRFQCPYCRGRTHTSTRSIDCSICSRTFSVVQGVPFFHPRAVKNDSVLSQKRWNRIYVDEQINRHDPINEKTVASYVQFLTPYMPLMKNGILDLGCGIAWTSLKLSRKHIPVTGIDISEEAIIKSKIIFDAGHSDGSFIQGDLTSLPLADSSFPFIYSCMSLEYVKDTKQALTESYRVLKKGGIMVAIVPVVSFTTLTYHQTRGDIPGIPIVKQLMEFIHIHLLQGKYMKYGYEQSFTVGSLRSLFQSAGFTVNKIDFFPMYYPLAFLPSSWQETARRMLRHRFFWPLVYVEAVKK